MTVHLPQKANEFLMDNLSAEDYAAFCMIMNGELGGPKAHLSEEMAALQVFSGRVKKFLEEDGIQTIEDFVAFRLERGKTLHYEILHQPNCGPKSRAELYDALERAGWPLEALERARAHIRHHRTLQQ